MSHAPNRLKHWGGEDFTAHGELFNTQATREGRGPGILEQAHRNA
jgi:hypothetical protein